MYIFALEKLQFYKLKNHKYLFRDAAVPNDSMQWKVFLLVLAVFHADGHSRQGKTNYNRKGKFFNIFNVITFPNDLCNKGSQNLEGKELL